MSNAVAIPQSTGHPDMTMNTAPSTEDVYTLLTEVHSLLLEYMDIVETLKPVVAQLKAHPTPSPFELIKILRDVL